MQLCELTQRVPRCGHAPLVTLSTRGGACRHTVRAAAPVPISNVATHVRQRVDRKPRTIEIGVQILNYLVYLHSLTSRTHILPDVPEYSDRCDAGFVA